VERSLLSSLSSHSLSLVTDLPVLVRPPQELDELSSEKVWQEVAEGIKFGKDDQALNGKLKLEQSQRDEEAGRTSTGTPHQPHFFSLDNSVSEGFFRYNL
jgi:hypothetical protein